MQQTTSGAYFTHLHDAHSVLAFNIADLYGGERGEVERLVVALVADHGEVHGAKDGSGGLCSDNLSYERETSALPLIHDEFAFAGYKQVRVGLMHTKEGAPLGVGEL